MIFFTIIGITHLIDIIDGMGIHIIGIIDIGMIIDTTIIIIAIIITDIQKITEMEGIMLQVLWEQKDMPIDHIIQKVIALERSQQIAFLIAEDMLQQSLSQLIEPFK